jgi:hypothetical protein
VWLWTVTPLARILSETTPKPGAIMADVRTIFRRAILAALISTFAAMIVTVCASEGAALPKVTGFFTDMRYVEDAGDLIGTEVWIVSARGRYFATVVEASGAPNPPVVVPVQVTGSRVRFRITTHLVDQDGNPAPDLIEDFDGTITRSRFSGTITSHYDTQPTKPQGEVNSERFSLRRGNTYWR